MAALLCCQPGPPAPIAVAAWQQLRCITVTSVSKCLHRSRFNLSLLVRAGRVPANWGKSVMTNATRAILLAGLSSFALAAPAAAQTNPEAQQNAEAQAQ